MEIHLIVKLLLFIKDILNYAKITKIINSDNSVRQDKDLLMNSSLALTRVLLLLETVLQAAVETKGPTHLEKEIYNGGNYYFFR